MLSILTPTPFLLAIIFELIQILSFPHHVIGVLVVQVSYHILGEDICFIICCANKHNLDESIFNEFPDKMIMHVNMLGSGACAHIFCHENCSNIVNSDNYGHFHLDTNQK